MVLARKASKTELRFAFFPVRVSENEECFLGLAGMARLAITSNGEAMKTSSKC